MTKPMKIDFVSDVVCPWCIIGLGGLEEALAKVGDLVDAQIHFQPFELNPDMPPEGQNIVEHITQKYGSTPAQSAANRQMIQSVEVRGADLTIAGIAGDMRRMLVAHDQKHIGPGWRDANRS